MNDICCRTSAEGHRRMECTWGSEMMDASGRARYRDDFSNGSAHDNSLASRG